MSEAAAKPEWVIIAHPLFLEQLDALIAQVSALKLKDPASFTKKNATKRLAAIAKLAFDEIPQDPTRAEYRQGDTLGDDYKHWFRAKFFQQYWLFFRYHAKARLIVLAWVNDEDTKRAYDSSDADGQRIPAPRADHISVFRSGHCTWNAKAKN